MAELSFFIGKGGVGKTTVSSAYAVHEAARNPRKKILLLSTDPAHSLADIFEQKLSDKPQRIRTPRAAQLFAWQINAEKQFRSFLEPYREDLLNLIESGTIFSRSEIEPLLETTLPGMAELSALIAIDELLRDGEYDRIVVDTAPIGHTLRMFELPQHFAKFLEFLDLAGSRDRWLSQRFSKSSSKRVGSEPFLQRWQEMVVSVGSALSNGRSELFMVTSPEEFSLNEAVRSGDALASSVPDLSVSAVVLNRAVVGKSSCVVCARRSEMTASAKRFIKQNFPALPLFVGEDAGNPILGASALLRFGEHVFGRKKISLSAAVPRSKVPELKPVPWPEIDVPLVFTVGKGGVGKTTVSAALGFKQRLASTQPVTVCSTDPAPSLDDVFQTNVGSRPQAVLGDDKFEAIEIDSVAEFRAWANAMQDKISAAFSTQSGGLHVDLSFDRQIFSSLLNIVPPGVDEIFAIFKILDLLRSESKADRRTVIIDMAPTGHALELLRMPERMLMWSRLLLKSLAPHRTLPLAQDVAVEIAGLGQQVRELVKIMQDPARSWAFAVMLAEPIPDQETSRLLGTLKELPVSVQAVFVNRILMPVPKKDAGRCARCDRARHWQAATLAGLKKRYRGKAKAIYLLPNFPEEIAGRKALQQFTKNLWQLA